MSKKDRVPSLWTRLKPTAKKGFDLNLEKYPNTYGTTKRALQRHKWAGDIRLSDAMTVWNAYNDATGEDWILFQYHLFYTNCFYDLEEWRLMHEPLTEDDVEKLERHANAPEMNKLHLKTLTRLSVPHCTSIAEAVNYVNAENALKARKAVV